MTKSERTATRLPSVLRSWADTDGRRDRRQARAARRRLEAELASYTSPAEVNDLLAIVGDSDDPEAQQVRNILTSKLAHPAPKLFAA